MDPEESEASAPSVEEATVLALAQAGLERDAALIEVLNEGGGAAQGERISGASARVRVSPIPGEAREGRRHLEEMLRLMEIEATVAVVRPASPAGGAGSSSGPAPMMLEIDGPDLGILIGWRGESLRAIQTIVNLMVSPSSVAPGGPRVIVDVAHYRERRERAVAQMARRIALEVARTGRPSTLDPMPPYERRAVPIALEADPTVTTESSGVDEARSVTIRSAASTPSHGARSVEAGRS